MNILNRSQVCTLFQIVYCFKILKNCHSLFIGSLMTCSYAAYRNYAKILSWSRLCLMTVGGQEWSPRLLKNDDLSVFEWSFHIYLFPLLEVFSIETRCKEWRWRIHINVWAWVCIPYLKFIKINLKNSESDLNTTQRDLQIFKRTCAIGFYSVERVLMPRLRYY